MQHDHTVGLLKLEFVFFRDWYVFSNNPPQALPLQVHLHLERPQSVVLSIELLDRWSGDLVVWAHNLLALERKGHLGGRK